MGKVVQVRRTVTILACLSVAMGLSVVSVLAGPTPGPGSLSITVNKAEEIAHDNNLSLALARLEVDCAEKQLTKAKAEVALAPSPVALRQAEIAVEKQKLLFEQTRRQMVLEVRSAYYKVISEMQQRAIAEKRLERVREQLESIRAKHDQGLATKLEVIDAEKSLIQAEGYIGSALAEEELAVLELKRVMGLSFTDPIAIVCPSEEVVEAIKLTLEEVVEKALRESLELYRLQWELEITQMQEESARNEHIPPLIKDIYGNRRMKAELELKEATRTAYLQAKQAWNDLRQAENRVRLSEKELEAAEEIYRIAKTRFDEGLESPGDLLCAQNGLALAQHGIVTAVFERNLARIQLLNLIGE